MMITVCKYKVFIGLILLTLIPGLSQWAFGSEEPEIQVQKASVRTIGTLAISQPEGTIHLRGWPQSKIEVHFSPATPEDHAPKLEQVGDGYRVGSSDPLHPTNGTTVVRAPRKMKLDILSKNSEIEIVNWSGSVLVRSSSGKISGKSLRSTQTQMICFECEMGLEDVKGSLVRMTGGKGDVSLDQVIAEEIYVETSDGDMSLMNTNAAHMLVSGDGHISAENGAGTFHFKTARGEVNLILMSAFISGSTEQGPISVAWRELAGEQQAYFYSESGNVTLGFPEDFTESVETVWNGKQVESDLPEWQPTPSKIVRWVSQLFRKWAKMESLGASRIDGKFFGFRPGKSPVIRVQTRKGQVKLVASQTGLLSNR